jgi:hypothetical protein
VPHYHHVLIGETLQQFLQGFDGFRAQSFDGVVIVTVLLFGEAVALEVEGDDSGEVFDFAGEGSEA